MIDVLTTDFHRNGVGGEPFMGVVFDWTDDETGQLRHMFGAVFLDGDGYARGRVAVIDLAEPQKAWRGDVFEPELVATAMRADAEGTAYPPLTRSDTR
jgi:hypothetical protein